MGIGSGHYYDRWAADNFEFAFKGTEIGSRPTASRSRYVVLRFNFSAFRQDPNNLDMFFNIHCTTALTSALRRNSDLFSSTVADRIMAPAGINAKLEELFKHAGEADIPLFVLIDEYDNFANTVLAHEGEAAYWEFAHGGGFFRSFFTTLKAGTEGGGIERMFITGVSPITLDDVTSGFNVARNVSLDPDFNEMMGFTEEEVRGLLELYAECGVFNQDVDTALDTMREWYDGYRFSEDATSTVYNADMVLYYLDHSIVNKPAPRRLIDDNVRIDYGKLRHLMVLSRHETPRFNGNFDVLREVVGTGKADAAINTGFPLERLTDRDNFLSLLYFFGLLSVEGPGHHGVRLRVPNQTVWELLYGHLRDAYRDAQVFALDPLELTRKVGRMAVAGEWRPMVEYLGKEIAEQSGIRAFINGEAFLQGFLLAQFGWTHHFVARPERELNMGYADIVLAPRTDRHPDLRYGYVIELKYLKRGALPVSEREAGTGGDARLERDPAPVVVALLREARSQLRRYLAARELRTRHPTVHFTGIALVFHGWELIACDAVSMRSGQADA